MKVAGSLQHLQQIWTNWAREKGSESQPAILLPKHWYLMHYLTTGLLIKWSCWRTYIFNFKATFLSNKKYCLESGQKTSSLNVTAVQPMKPTQLLLHSNLLSCIWLICSMGTFQQSTQMTVLYASLIHSSLNIWPHCTSIRATTSSSLISLKIVGIIFYQSFVI